MGIIVTILCLTDSAHSLDTRDKHACLVSELNMSITQHSITLTLARKYIKTMWIIIVMTIIQVGETLLVIGWYRVQITD